MSQPVYYGMCVCVCVCVMVLFSLGQYSSTKTILVRNVGNREGKFQLETDP